MHGGTLRGLIHSAQLGVRPMDVGLAAYKCFPFHANIRSNVLASCRM